MGKRSKIKGKKPGRPLPPSKPQLGKKRLARDKFAILNLKLVLVYLRYHLLRLWAIVTTVVSLVLAYLQILPEVDLVYAGENRRKNEHLIPLRITNNGYFDVRVIRIIGVGSPDEKRGDVCDGLLRGAGYEENLHIEANTSYDIFYGYKGTPSWHKWGAVRVIVEYEVPGLWKRSVKSEVFVPDRDKDGNINWIFGNSRDFPPCKTPSRPTENHD